MKKMAALDIFEMHRAINKRSKPGLGVFIAPADPVKFDNFLERYRLDPNKELRRERLLSNYYFDQHFAHIPAEQLRLLILINDDPLHIELFDTSKMKWSER